MVYEGRNWDTSLPTADLRLKESSTVYLLHNDVTPWPQGPLPLYPWAWADCDELMMFRHLAGLLEDHTSPVEFTLEGIQYCIDMLAIPEDEWDGAELTNPHSSPPSHLSHLPERPGNHHLRRAVQGR